MEFQPVQRRAPKHAKFDAIHRALLTGLLSNVGTKSDTYEYLGPRGGRFSIFPGSGLFGVKPKWVMAGELVETTKLYARTCAGVQPQWIERAAGHLVERSYSDPRWDAKSASVIATEKVSLYGLVLIPARNVPYAPINPKISREMFVHHALVLGDVRGPIFEAAFFRRNAALIREVERLEAKIRQKNLLADVSTRFAFYDARVPLEVTDGARFETWRRGVEKQDPHLLMMKKEDLLRADAPAITVENYPDVLADAGGGLKLPLTYRFEPGETRDGLTLTVPIAALPQLRPGAYEWLVPGMLEEKISALLRALPGGMRRNFVPVPTWAKAASEALRATHGEGSEVGLRDALANWLTRQVAVEIKGSDFSEAELPAFMRMAYQVMGDEGKLMGVGRDLQALQRQFASQAATTFAGLHERRFNRDGIVAWDFGELPREVTVQQYRMSIRAYPALVDEGAACGLRLLPTEEGAMAAHRGGVLRLFMLQHRRELKPVMAGLPKFQQMALQYHTLGVGKTQKKSAELREDVGALIVDRAMLGNGELPRDGGAFEKMAREALVKLPSVVGRVTELVASILEQYHYLALIMDTRGGEMGVVGLDVMEHLGRLLPLHFLKTTPWLWLEQFPRYLGAMRVRLEKWVAGGPSVYERQMEGMSRVADWRNKMIERERMLASRGVVDPALVELRWMLEEYEVSVFAAELGTVVPVSERRLERQWEKVRVE